MSANLTSRKLTEKLDKVAKEWDDKINTKEHPEDKWKLEKGKEQALAQAIMTTPLPNTKADLFEFMTMTQAAFLSSSTPYHSAAAYNTKYQESLLKAKSLFARDDIFSSIINEEQNVQTKYLKIHKKQPKVGINPTIKLIIGVVGYIAAFGTIVGIISALGII